MSLNLSQIFVDYLQNHANEKFTAREIADWIFVNFPEECKEKQSRSKAVINPLDTDDALIQQIVNEISSKRSLWEKSNIKTTEGRPRKYYYTEQSDSAEVEQAEDEQPSPAVSVKKIIKEFDLYPMLTAFLLSELNLYSMRIDEKRSQNRQGPNGNKWLFLIWLD